MGGLTGNGGLVKEANFSLKGGREGYDWGLGLLREQKKIGEVSLDVPFLWFMRCGALGGFHEEGNETGKKREFLVFKCI